MRYGKKFVTIAFAVLMLGAGFVYEASAQRRGSSISTGVRRPIIVRRHIYRDPFWRSRYGYGYGYYDPFYDSYLRQQEQRYYLQRDLEGNRRELAEHKRKYYADGVLTDKERRELADDEKDVRNSKQDIRRYGRYY